MYKGSQAYRMDEAANEYDYSRRPVLTTIEGGKPSRRGRQASASPDLSGIVAYVLALAIVLFVAGGINVALTSGTVGRLNSNKETKAQIKELTSYNGELLVERSMLSQAERVSQIAEDNLGMVYASDAQVLDLD